MEAAKVHFLNNCEKLDMQMKNLQIVPLKPTMRKINQNSL